MKLNKDKIKMLIIDAIQEFEMDRTQNIDTLADSYAINIERIVKGDK